MVERYRSNGKKVKKHLLVQFKKREKHPWRSVNFRLQPATLLKVPLLHVRIRG